MRPIVQGSLASERIILALNLSSIPEARALLDSLGAPIGAIRFGLEFGLAHGWAAAEELATSYKLPAFFDTKLKDVPKTVGVGTRSLMRHRPRFFTVMADNSRDALKEIVSGRDSGARDAGLSFIPAIVGVTVLTSITVQESEEIYGAAPAVRVPQFARKAVECGLDAIVCSPEEVGSLRADTFFARTSLITPGIRPIWAAANDQKRMATPAEAIARGADYLVIGTPIIAPPPDIGTPAKALSLIAEEIEQGLNERREGQRGLLRVP